MTSKRNNKTARRILAMVVAFTMAFGSLGTIPMAFASDAHENNSYKEEKPGNGFDGRWDGHDNGHHNAITGQGRGRKKFFMDSKHIQMSSVFPSSPSNYFLP